MVKVRKRVAGTYTTTTMAIVDMPNCATNVQFRINRPMKIGMYLRPGVGMAVPCHVMLAKSSHYPLLAFDSRRKTQT